MDSSHCSVGFPAVPNPRCVPFPDLWGGAVPDSDKDVNAKLLAGSTALLQSLSSPSSHASSSAPVGAPSPGDPPGKKQNRTKRKNVQRDNSLLGGLRRLTERMSKPDFKGDPIARLRDFVAAAENSASALPVRKDTNRKDNPPKQSAPAPARQPPRGSSVAEEKPTYAEAAKRSRPPSIPVSLYQAHWKGTLVPVEDFASRVSTASAGDRLVFGVLDQLPAEISGMVVPDTLTVTLVVLPSVECDLQKTDITAPAACVRGHLRAQQLNFIQLGATVWPLAWKPTAVQTAVPVDETVTLRAQVFSQLIPPPDWTKLRARPHATLTDMVMKLPAVCADDVFDVFDVRRPDNPLCTFYSCTVRAKKSAVPKFLQASGQGGLLIKTLMLAAASSGSGRPSPSVALLFLHAPSNYRSMKAPLG